MAKARYYPHNGRPFLEVVGNGSHSVLRVRQATEGGHIECDPNGVADLAYPTSELRRARVKERGAVASALMAGEPSQCVFIDYDFT